MSRMRSKGTQSTNRYNDCFNDPATTEISTYLHTLSLPDDLPIYIGEQHKGLTTFGREIVETARDPLEPAVDIAAQQRGRRGDAGAGGDQRRLGRPLAVQQAGAAQGILAVHRHDRPARLPAGGGRSGEHTSELQSLMRTSYAVFCLKKQMKIKHQNTINKRNVLTLLND